ncbi:MAG: DUF6602 domain-containing protein [Planctomycetota bacterium]
MNPILDRLRTAVGRALREAREATRLRDQTTTGTGGAARELLVESILRPALPPDVSFASGKLVDAMGGASRPLDVVVYAPRIVPLGFCSTHTDFFPTEAVLSAVAVESKLTSAGVRNAVEATRSVRRLQLLPTGYHWREGEETARCPAPKFALFALCSDLRGDPDDELRRLRDALGREDELLVSDLCVAGRGYWYWSDDRWRRFAATATHDEVLAYMGRLADTVPELLATKGNPRFGQYLVRGYGDECPTD